MGIFSFIKSLFGGKDEGEGVENQQNNQGVPLSPHDMTLPQNNDQAIEKKAIEENQQQLQDNQQAVAQTPPVNDKQAVQQPVTPKPNQEMLQPETPTVENPGQHNPEQPVQENAQKHPSDTQTQNISQAPVPQQPVAEPKPQEPAYEPPPRPAENRSQRSSNYQSGMSRASGEHAPHAKQPKPIAED